MLYLPTSSLGSLTSTSVTSYKRRKGQTWIIKQSITMFVSKQHVCVHEMNYDRPSNILLENGLIFGHVKR